MPDYGKATHTIEELKEMQAWPLERKIQVTQTRILEWGQHYNGQIYVAFSGGKDSTVLLDLVRRVYPNTLAVFIDTGVEYPEVRQFIKTVPNVMWLKPGMGFKQVIETYGYPIISKNVAQRIYEARKYPNSKIARMFDKDDPYAQRYGRRFSVAKWKWLLDSDIPISHMCCTVMKKNPSKKFEKETGLKPIIALLAEESDLRKTEWMKDGCNAFENKRPTSRPMSFWLEQDVLEYITRFNIPYCSIYGDIAHNLLGEYYTTGVQRTGCIYCGFGCHLEDYPNHFQMLKETHPKLWDYCMRPKDENGLGMREVMDFIGVKVD